MKYFNWFSLVSIFLTIGFAESVFAQVSGADQKRAQSVAGIKVPDGFVVSRIAADEIATNIYCMAVSPKGEVFVSGPGYIKALVDSDGDGIFDKSRLFAAAPRSGAQGICFDGNDLLCTGDGGLLRFADGDGDGISDGPPEKLLEIKTGGEHDAHAIRKGPDGWWYLLAGNGVPALPAEYFDMTHAQMMAHFYDSASPVKNPRAGFLMRISPDWKRKQIYCHGFRNAYDFDFNSLGEVFVYDSDGERDISLPWYRPTRVFRMRPGDDAGWVAAGWKRPDYFVDMPPVIGRLGRGSPTGVIVGNSQQFPNSYRDAIFVADWTFGRVVAFRRGKDGNYDSGTDFAIATGQFGFAVTDLDFAADGSLLISVGGRGTEGAIYQVAYPGNKNDITIQPLTETQTFIKESKSRRLSQEELIVALNSTDRQHCEAALEALIGHPDAWKSNKPGISVGQLKLSRAVNAAVKRVGFQGNVLLERFYSDITADPAGIVKKTAIEGIGYSRLGNPELNRNQVLQGTLNQALSVLSTGNHEEPLAIVRVAQLAFGGCGGKGVDQMFVGYTPRVEPKLLAWDRRPYTIQLAKSLQAYSGDSAEDRLVSHELGRLAAMIGFGSNELQAEMAKRLMDPASSAPHDIHWMNCLSQVIGMGTAEDSRQSRLTIESDPITPEVELIIAQSLVGIGQKIKRDHQNIDRNFYPRLKTLARTLIENSKPSLPMTVAKQLSGDESEIFLLDVMPKEAKQRAIDTFASRIEQSPETVTSSQLNVLASDRSGKYLPLIRSFSNRAELQNVVIGAVAKNPLADDKPLFSEGLASSDLSTVKNAAIGLRKLFTRADPNEMMAAFYAANRVGWDKPSVSVRDQLMLLLEKHIGEKQAATFGYQQKKNKLNQSDVLDRWGEWLKQEYPEKYAVILGSTTTTALLDRVKQIDWSRGDSTRGQQLYGKLQCAQCHDGGSRLGPRLEGISKRFSPADIFKSIVAPNQQVPERYRALMIETSDGQLFRGSMIYESVDGITLQKADGGTARINKDDIESRTVSSKSLMPEGLLKDATDQELADLHSYLKTK